MGAGGWKRRKAVVGRSLKFWIEAVGTDLVKNEIVAERRVDEERNGRGRIEEGMRKGGIVRK